MHPTSVFAHNYVRTDELAASLLRLGRWIVENGVDAPGAYRAARDLLLGLPPRITGHAGGPLRGVDENGVGAARRLVKTLERGTLAIQGPPGTGKTYTGARMICDLVRAGKRSEEHTSELQSRLHLVCRLLLEKKKNNEPQRVPAPTLHSASCAGRRARLCQRCAPG